MKQTILLVAFFTVLLTVNAEAKQKGTGSTAIGNAVKIDRLEIVGGNVTEQSYVHCRSASRCELIAIKSHGFFKYRTRQPIFVSVSGRD